jgi:hypothetical protein
MYRHVRLLRRLYVHEREEKQDCKNSAHNVERNNSSPR